jgi:probable rRNA maturation factor
MLATRPPLKLSISAGDARAWVPTLRRHLLRAHAMLRSPLCEVSLAIVRAPQMASLHRQFLGIDGPTDVLTFELEHDARNRVISGEIVLCSSVARTRARDLGHAPADEALLYAIHGLLHLSGFDDKTAGDFAVMHAKEDEILTRIGVGPVFRPKTGAGTCLST